MAEQQTDDQCCEHKYLRDIETCPYCELIEAEDLAADLGADNTRAWIQVEELTRDRDEARDVARRLLVIVQAYRPTGQVWGERYQWLKEEPGGE